jgi:hypothetical protein
VHNVEVKRASLLPFLSLLVVSACAVVPAPLAPEPIREGGALDAHIESLDTVGSGFALGLNNYGLIYGDKEGLFVQPPGATDPIALGTTLGQPKSATELSDSSVLLLGSEGLFLLSEGLLTPSPLQTAIASLGVEAIVATPGEAGDDLWLMADHATYVWSEGLLYTVEPSGLTLPTRRAAWGSPVDGKQALWIESEGALYSIRFDDGLVAAQLHRASTVISAMAVDGYETLWMAADGDLFRRWPDDRWEWFSTPFAPSAMASVSGSGELWIETAEGLWHHSSDVFRPVAGTTGAELLGVDGAGRAIARYDGGLIRVSEGRPLLFIGLTEGQELELETEVQLVPTLPESVISMVATLDGAPVELSAEWAVLLDPLLLENGAHELEVVVTYDDEEETTRSLFFSVGEFVPPTWQDDIRPIFSQSCAQCHLGGGQATVASGGDPLETASQWQTAINDENSDLLGRVESGNMPLNNPSLSPAEVQTIKEWIAGGFLE